MICAMADKKRGLQVQGKRDKTDPVPFDEALRRLVNTPPKPKKSSAGGGAERAKPSKAKHMKPR